MHFEIWKRTEPRDFENRIKEQIQNSYKKSFTIPTSVERNDKWRKTNKGVLNGKTQT